MPDGGETGEKILFFFRDDLGDGAAFRADDGEIGLGGPEESFKEALAVENLAGLDGEDPAGDAVDGLLAAGLGLVEPEAVFGKEEGLNFLDIAEVFRGELEADEAVGGGGGEFFGAFAGGGEDDFAFFGVDAGAGVALVELFDEELLFVEVLGADGFRGGFAFGDALGKVAGRFGAVDWRY